MINELLTMLRNVESWGISIPSRSHSKFPAVSKSAPHIEVSVNTQGIVDVKETPDRQHHEYVISNHSKGLVFKRDIQRATSLAKKLQICATATIQLADTIPETPYTGSLKKLATVLRKIDFDDFAVQLAPQLPEGTCYICLELASELRELGESPVHSTRCYDTILKHFLAGNSVTSGELDAFGNDAEGWEKTWNACRPQCIKVFCRNQYTKCLSRYGLNSMESCRIGNKTRQQIGDLLFAITSPENQTHIIREGKKTTLVPGYWYRCSRGAKEKWIVISTIANKQTAILEVPFVDDFDEGIWSAETKKLLQLARQNSSVGKPISGQLLVIRQLKAASVVEYSRMLDSEAIYRAVTEWDTGIHNGRIPYHRLWLLNVVTLCKQLNTEYKWQKSRFIPLLNKPRALFTIADAYDLFLTPSLPDYDRERAVTGVTLAVLERLAKVTSLVLRNKLADPQKPKEPTLTYLVPLCFNLILHKIGLRKETYMDHWAFCLGEMFSVADYIHRLYHASKGGNAPKSTLGAQYIHAAKENPRATLARFSKAFDVFFNWANSPTERETAIHEKANAQAMKYRRLFQKLGDGSQLPTYPKSEEVILITQGYMYINPRAEKKPEGDAAEAEVDSNDTSLPVVAE